MNNLFGLLGPGLDWLASGATETAPGVMRLLHSCAEMLGGCCFNVETWTTILALALPLVCILIMLGPIVTIFPMFAIWLERKVSAHMQSRLGPMEVGWHGWLQSVADGVKLLAKEDIIPRAADRALFILGPIFTFTGVFLLLAVLPYGPFLYVTDLHLGVIYVAAVGSLEVIGVLMAGWASNNKWSLFGTMRLATQLVSYEIPLGLSFLSAVLVAGTFQLGEYNGYWRVDHYEVLSTTGEVSKKLHRDQVNPLRQELKAKAEQDYAQALGGQQLDRVFSQFTGAYTLNAKATTRGDWKKLFRPAADTWRKADGSDLNAETVMAEVREEAKRQNLKPGALEGDALANFEAAVGARLAEKFGAITAQLTSAPSA